MNIRITSASNGDIEAIVGFQLRMALETEDLILDGVVLNEGVKAVIGDPSKATYYIARISNVPGVGEGEEVAAGMLMITLEWSDWRNGWVWWIQSVYVREEYRKYGVFRSLYGHIKQLVAESQNVKGIRLYVDKRNVRAQKVYESLGMTGEHYSTFEWMK